MPMLKRFFFWMMYFREPPWDTGISPPELMQHIASHPPGRALDVGCGRGTNVITLAKNGWQATRIDFIGRAIAEARRRAKHQGVQAEFLVGDVTQPLKLQGTFDLILDMGCFHSLSPQGKIGYTQNIERWLAPGGTYLLYTWTDVSTSGDGSGEFEKDVARFCQSLDLALRVDGSEKGKRPSAWLTFIKTRG
jgi:SAM-dependent methyltransferase